jgi:hypothetical protein
VRPENAYRSWALSNRAGPGPLLTPQSPRRPGPFRTHSEPEPKELGPPFGSPYSQQQCYSRSESVIVLRSFPKEQAPISTSPSPPKRGRGHPLPAIVAIQWANEWLFTVVAAAPFAVGSMRIDRAPTADAPRQVSPAISERWHPGQSRLCRLAPRSFLSCFRQRSRGPFAKDLHSRSARLRGKPT